MSIIIRLNSGAAALLTRLTCALLCVSLLAVPLLAQQSSTPPAVNSVAPLPRATSQTAAAPAPAISEFDINGLKLLVKRRSSSQTVAVGLYFRGGAANTTPQNAGIEGLLLDAASEASTNFSRERVHAELAHNASAIAGTAGLDYSALVMGSTSTGFARTWEIFADVALHPKFDPVDLARLKDQRLASLREQASVPDSYIEDLQARVAYANHPYLNDPSGTTESIARISVADLKQYHQQMMQTSRMVMIAVGDVDPQDLRAKVEASFGKVPRGNFKTAATPPLSFSSPTVNVTARSLPTNYIKGVYAAPGLTSPDYYPMTVATDILQFLVYQEVRLKRNLSYAPDAFVETQGANLGGISVTAVDANAAVGVMLDQIDVMRNNEIRDDFVQSRINGYVTKYYMLHETNAAQVAELADFELIGGGWRNSLNAFDRLKQVTPQDIQRVSQKYMRNLQFVVIGNTNAINRDIFLRPSAG